MVNPVKVRKRSGEFVDFDIHKLKSSLARSGADDSQIDAVVMHIKASLHNGISTREIYQRAYQFLRKLSYRSAGRYKLKKAILELGPTGFPFEKFVARLLSSQGYEVQVGQLVPGKCVTHEVDVVARKQGKQLMVECKFHSDSNSKSDVKVSLYIHSRFNDVKDTWKSMPENQGIRFEGMLVTNSRFTEDALQYGICAGINMVSWDSPIGESLRDWVDRSGLHPITSLKTLKKSEKQTLLEKDIVLCCEIPAHPEILNSIIPSERRRNAVLKEVKQLI